MKAARSGLSGDAKRAKNHHAIERKVTAIQKFFLSGVLRRAYNFGKPVSTPQNQRGDHPNESKVIPFIPPIERELFYTDLRKRPA
jgi:hypothetical protein